MITPERARELWRYEPDTGLFFWNVDPVCQVDISKPAGTITQNGYIAIKHQTKSYKGHRLAWAISHGEWPPHDIDHINGDKSDNRLCNLRHATRRQNSYNCGIRSTNTSGFKGVSFHKRTGKWQASIQAGNRQKYLGLFPTLDQAADAYRNEAMIIHGEFARFE